MKTVFYSELENKIDGMRNLEADSAELSQSLIEKDTVLQASFTSLDITTIFVVNKSQEILYNELVIPSYSNLLY